MKSILFVLIALSGITFGENTLPDYVVFGEIHTINYVDGFYFSLKVYTPETPTRKEAKAIMEEIVFKYAKTLFSEQTKQKQPKIAIALYDSLDVSKLQYRAQYFIPASTGGKKSDPIFSYKQSITSKFIDYSKEPPWWKK